MCFLWLYQLDWRIVMWCLKCGGYLFGFMIDPADLEMTDAEWWDYVVDWRHN